MVETLQGGTGLEGVFALSSTTAVQGTGILQKASVGILPNLGNFQISSISQTHEKKAYRNRES